MLTHCVLGADNKELKKIELSNAIFASPIRRQLLFDCTQIYLANKRQGTVKAKDRGEISRTTKKVYRQKGTGNARHGSLKAGIYVGGGAAFPPRPRDWHTTLPQSMKKEALKTALALRKKEGNLIVVDHFPAKEIKTKAVAGQLAKWGVKKGLLVTDAYQENLLKSVRNIPYISLAVAENINVLDVLAHEKVVVTEKALESLQKRLA